MKIPHLNQWATVSDPNHSFLHNLLHVETSLKRFIAYESGQHLDCQLNKWLLASFSRGGFSETFYPWKHLVQLVLPQNAFKASFQAFIEMNKKRIQNNFRNLNSISQKGVCTIRLEDKITFQSWKFFFINLTIELRTFWYLKISIRTVWLLEI